MSARALPPGELHLWRLSLALPAAAQAAAAATLALEEQQRAARFHFAADALAFTAARGQLRQLLGAYLAAPPASLAFAANEYGKPHLAAPVTPLHFNLAHSGAWALVALSAAGPVGVDVEVYRPVTDRAAIARRFFAPGEAQRLTALPEPEQEAAFIRCWTRKEAYIKARGLGLTLPLDAFEVTLDPGRPRLLWVQGDAAEPAAWQMAEPTMPDGYAAALAVRATSMTVVDCGVWPATAGT